jgi:hypothetical protein
MLQVIWLDEFKCISRISSLHCRFGADHAVIS